jgi:methylmalonyl-CoA/ethylmalonyl-CoA epimerase
MGDGGVRDVGNTKIELLELLGEPPITAFLEKNLRRQTPQSRGRRYTGRARQVVGGGARVLGDGNPKIGAHGKLVLFLHPKDFFGTLVELEQS